MKLTNKLISFNIDNGDGNNIFGFKIFNNAGAKQYLTAVKLLENNNIEFSTSTDSYEYQSQYFTVTNVSNADLKVLSKFFDIDFDDSESNVLGFFPDAVEDAYDEGLFDENDDSEESFNDYDYDDDEY